MSKKEYNQQYNASHRAEKREYDKKRNLINKERNSIQKKKVYRANPAKFKNRNLKRTYGITIEQYNQMFVDQNGQCAICEGRQQKGRALCVDHDHITGKLRKLLCYRCNFAIGQFKDDMNLVQKSLDYLKKHNEI